MTSTMMSDLPPELKIDTCPLRPTGTMTMLATVWPAAKLRFDASGFAAPWGKTVT